MVNPIDETIQQIIQHFGFEVLPIEGTLFKKTYRSQKEFANGDPLGTAMIGMYCGNPPSLSCFHRLTHDEVWHFYLGDPLILYLLYEDGSSEEVVMGHNVFKGQHIQYTIPAGVWQGGCLAPGGKYAVFGCSLAPGFTGNCFEGGIAEKLIEKYPKQKDIIVKLSVNGHEAKMPEGFET